jgi:hypothetical protein
MKRTPQQTYLDERLHSASGLGWSPQQTESACRGLARFVATYWLQFASLHWLGRLRAAR